MGAKLNLSPSPPILTLYNEQPYDLYENLKSKEEYQKLKEERCDFLWKAIERSIPDVRQRAKVVLTASPLTHERFNRR
jgi:phytoene dehydrogenase-like protein